MKSGFHLHSCLM